jgi:hypothetical protein
MSSGHAAKHDPWSRRHRGNAAHKVPLLMLSQGASAQRMVVALYTQVRTIDPAHDEASAKSAHCIPLLPAELEPGWTHWSARFRAQRNKGQVRALNRVHGSCSVALSMQAATDAATTHVQFPDEQLASLV